MNAHIPKPVAEEKEVKAKDEEKIAEKEGDKIGDDKDKVGYLQDGTFSLEKIPMRIQRQVVASSC